MSPPKTVLVVGANRGIGNQLATRFLNGNYVVYGTVRPETRTDPSVHQLSAKGGKILELDLLDETSVNQAAKDFGHQPLDILINVAGLYYLWDDKPFSDQSADDLVEHFRVNVVGPFTVSKAFLPSLSLSPSAKVINISSDFASIAGGNASYRISKAGVNQLTKNMAVDLEKSGKTNIKTLAVHPGYVATKMTGYIGEDDMETCMSSLVKVIERFGTEAGEDLPNGGYVRWNGEVMAY
ncbi:NAD(P)-binding protein [Venturia nashicola]|nr:NAD(P)-binding protein [Venturia nashicola]